MDDDFDFTFGPSDTIYGCRAVKLDPANEGKCYLGSLNAMCIGITPQQTQNAAGQIGNNTGPFILAQPTTDSTYPYVPGGSGPSVPVYGPNRRCLADVDSGFNGQIAPNDLVICGNTGMVRKASPFGPWNQWVIGIALSFASKDQTVNLKVQIFPWNPTGS